MKIAFPTVEDRGMESPVYGHFGSAPFFVLVDAQTDALEIVNNADAGHLHGNCQPLKALGHNPVDAVVVGGIGAGALRKLLAAGIRVYRAVEGSVRENLHLARIERLPAITLDQTCGGHHGSGDHCSQ